MTPEERLAAHEQWLLDHDKVIADIQDILQETVAIQRRQSAVLLELAEHVARLLDKSGDGG
jgi:hypothetical protein